MFDAFTTKFGRIDILVANAGLQRDAPVTAMTLADWSRVIDVNLTGQFLCMREAVRRFDAQTSSDLSRARGKIVCMSSVHEIIPWAGHVNYAAPPASLHLASALSRMDREPCSFSDTMGRYDNIVQVVPGESLTHPYPPSRVPYFSMQNGFPRSRE